MADSDYWTELEKKLRAGENAQPAEVTPGPQDDYWTALEAKLKSEATTDRLTAPTKANSRGYVLPTPDWNSGMAVANGMAQGLLPQIAAAVHAQGQESFHPFGIGLQPDTSLPSYAPELQRLQAARAAYAKENPGTSDLAEAGGSLATMIPIMAAGAGVLGAGTRAVTGVAPWLSGAADFLSGASKVRGLQTASQATRGALEGTAAAAGSSGLSDTPLKDQLEAGGGLGALLGPAGAYLSNKFTSHVTKTAAETAQAALDAGINLRAGDVPGSSKAIQALNSIYGSGGTVPREQFAQNLSAKAGYPTKEINQEWVNSSKADVGKTMNQIQSVYSIPKSDPNLTLDIHDAWINARSKFSDPDDVKKIDNFYSKLADHAQNGISGPIYKNITQKGGLIDNFVSKDAFKPVAGDAREVLDDAWGRSLPPDKKAAWDQARGNYKLLDTIDNSMGASGAAEGVYNPKKLLAAVERKYGDVEKAGDIGLLARAGQFIEPPGAAPASAKHGLLRTAGGLTLAAAAGSAAGAGTHVLTHWGPEALSTLMQNPESMTIPALLGIGAYGAGAAVNKAVNSPRATQYMLDIARGVRQPMLQGNNPTIPFAVQQWNQH